MYMNTIRSEPQNSGVTSQLKAWAWQGHAVEKKMSNRNYSTMIVIMKLYVIQVEKMNKKLQKYT